MCIFWSTEYYLCGHTRLNQSRSKPCPKKANCPQRKYITLQTNLQTCQVCWDAGDRRVNKPFAKMLIRHAAERRERQQCKAERSGRCQAQTVSEIQAGAEGEVECEAESEGDEVEDAGKGVDSEDKEGPAGEKEYEFTSGTARPETPLIHWKVARWHKPHYDDLPRVCDPVRVGSIRKDYRAQRGRTWECDR